MKTTKATIFLIALVALSEATSTPRLLSSNDNSDRPTKYDLFSTSKYTTIEATTNTSQTFKMLPLLYEELSFLPSKDCKGLSYPECNEGCQIEGTSYYDNKTLIFQSYFFENKYIRSLHIGKDYGEDETHMPVAEKFYNFLEDTSFDDVNGGIGLGFLLGFKFKGKTPEYSYIARQEGKGVFFFGFDSSYTESNKEIFEITTNSSKNSFISSFRSEFEILKDEVTVQFDISQPNLYLPEDFLSALKNQLNDIAECKYSSEDKRAICTSQKSQDEFPTLLLGKLPISPRVYLTPKDNDKSYNVFYLEFYPTERDRDTKFQQVNREYENTIVLGTRFLQNYYWHHKKVHSDIVIKAYQINEEKLQELQRSDEDKKRSSQFILIGIAVFLVAVGVFMAIRSRKRAAAASNESFDFGAGKKNLEMK